ncbi:MAG: glycosyltransferase family 1 protein [Actinomycetota bacterium]|nr:glycosyltransferase family 1 protein [Actinomycetota bacterium]
MSDDAAQPGARPDGGTGEPLRVAIDATPLLTPLTGIGVVTRATIDGLARRPDVAVSAFAVSFRGRDRLGGVVGPGVEVHGRPMAAWPLREAWRRVDWPPLRWWIGDVDVVHSPNYVVPPSRPAAEVVTVQDLTPFRLAHMGAPGTEHVADLVRRAVRRGAWVHASSRFVADEVRTLLDVDAERVVVVPHGVEPQLAGDPTRGRRLAGAERYVVAVGTIEPRKGLPVLVEAFDEVAGTDPDVHLVLAGSRGWGAEPVDEAVARARHGDRVRLLGRIDDTERTDLLAGAAVLAYPSLYEGFGIPPLEAMAQGVPVVCSDAGALPETVGDAAEVTVTGDAASLAAGLAAVLGDDDRRSQLAVRGRRRAATFTWERAVSGLVDLYRSAAAARQDGPRRLR